MTPLTFQGFLFCIISFSSTYAFNDFKNYFLWKTNFALISLLENPFALVDSAAPPEEGKKLKEKIKRGKDLLEELNVNLEKIKKSLAEKAEVDKDVLEKVIEIKNEFMEMQVDATDIPKDLLDKFKEKTIEALKLIMESFGLNKIMQKAKQKVQPETVEMKAEPEVVEMKAEPEVVEMKAEPEEDAVDNKIDSKTEKKFDKEL